MERDSRRAKEQATEVQISVQEDSRPLSEPSRQGKAKSHGRTGVREDNLSSGSKRKVDSFMQKSSFFVALSFSLCVLAAAANLVAAEPAYYAGQTIWII